MSESISTADARTELERVSANLRWSWERRTAQLLASLPGADPARHPVANAAAAAEDGTLDAWVTANAAALREVAAEVDALERRHGAPEIAYFCPEFGIAAQLPQYSGGLGILAGDHLKAASDLALPLIGVGLFYRRGFFRQDVVDGEQRDRTEPVDPHAVGAIDTGVTVSVDVDDVAVTARVWQMWVGSTRMVLLDTDVDDNPPTARAITDRLYAGDRRHRLSQELVLGAGGVKALRALGIEPSVWHLNEGHACFLLLERLAELTGAGADLDTAIDEVRRSSLFTTHTPVPAGIDRFSRELVSPELQRWASQLGVEVDTILDWATLPSDGAERPFNTAALAFWLCDRANGVSQLHSTVSRKLFASLPRAAGVEGITNGVHARTWVAPAIQDLYDDTLGRGWENGDPDAWARVDALDVTRLDEIRRGARQDLVGLVATTTGTALDPERCIFGFARRFATYKRAALLLRDPAGLQASIDAGAQFVFAGKAHPADDEGKRVLAEIAEFAASDAAGGAIVLVPDYDIDIARALYAGCDVWLNNPIRPHEACGTSGEKAALNGGLNCSISDGWWADWAVDGIGWVIPTSEATDADERDDEEARALHRLVTGEVLPLFDAGPDQWYATVTAMLAHLGPKVTTGRMVAEYERRFYQPIRK